MRLLVLILASLGVAAGASPGAVGGAMMNMPTITELDVICDKSGMTVTIDFSQPFNGIIFSKGHYSNPACRYVDENSGRSSFTIDISSNECGSMMGQARGDTSRTQLSNTIIVQNDKTIQEIWDVARTLNCEWIDNYVKTVNFNPFTVGMLQPQEVRFEGDQAIECWMDLQLGQYPDIDDINSIVKIGDTLSLLIYARDREFEYDVAVKDCYAFAGPDFDDDDTPRLQLTDSDGCVLKDKLISPFYAAREDDGRGSILVTYALVSAFKFPDVMDVYMSCNVEICKGDCESKCSSSVTTTEPPRRYGSTLFGEPIYTTKPTTQDPCPPGSTDPACAPPTTPKSQCYPGSRDPACNTGSNFGKQLFGDPISTTPEPTTTTTEKRCFAGSLDPECPPLCYVGSRDPRCPKPTTTQPPCYPGSTRPECPPNCKVNPSDRRCKPKCYPGSTDPRCPKPTEKPEDDCFPGSLNPNCETATEDGRYGSILFPATITTTPSTTTRQTTQYSPVTVPFPTTTTKRTGSVLFPDFSELTTKPPKPSLKPKTTTTKSPNRGKQLREPQSKPEPSGKEWEGEARYHAFHSYHYQRGDGRRSRTFGRRLSPKNRKTRSAVHEISLTHRPLLGKMPLKLSRNVQVASPPDFSLPQVADETTHIEQFVCLSSIAAISIIAIFSVLIAVVLGLICLYMRRSKAVIKKVDQN